MSLLRRALSLLLPLALGSALANCGDDASNCVGDERCACSADATCSEGLSCVSNVCVASSSNGGADQGKSGSGGGDAGGTAGSAHDAGGKAGSAHDAGGASTNPGSAGADDGQGGSDGQTCHSFETYADGTVPTVFVLVDRSGSMFLCLSQTSPNACVDPDDTAWAALKDGTLEMIDALDGSVRFGFGSFSGERPDACPDFDKVAAKLDNYDAIAEAYEGVAPPTKGETPTADILAQVQQILSADDSPGRKYVLLVTDGEPDFCDDGNPLCPVDATVGALQALHDAGIETMIFGVDSPLSTISEETLQAFANAGVGEPVQAPSVLSAPNVQLECTGTPGWLAAYTASGSTGTSLGTYSSNGSAKVFRPDPTDQQALSDLLQGTVAGIKSCVFDLAAGLHVNLARLAEAGVAIEGQSVARDDANGWRMNDATQLELVGEACDRWREPGSRSIDFDFPCGLVTDD